MSNLRFERFAGLPAWRVCLFGWPTMRGPVRLHRNIGSGYRWHLDVVCWRISRLHDCTCGQPPTFYDTPTALVLTAALFAIGLAAGVLVAL